MKLMQVKDPATVMALINENFMPLDSEPVSLEAAGGRILAEDIIVDEDVPAFDRSTVDGYAVRAHESFGASESMPALFELIGEGLMGREAPPLKKPGQCCLVHTGGMLPANADAVVMIEDTDRTETMIQCFRQAAPGENVIHRGEDLTAGATALIKGRKLRAPEIGLLASLGITTFKAHRQPVVGFFSSGDELIDYHSKELPLAKIRDSNAPALMEQTRQKGAIFKYGGILPDRFATFISKSKAMLATVDLLVFSGGSSVGSRDFTAMTMQELGKPGLLVEGVAIQPGKPTLLANCDGKPVLGLPGHPVSALNIFDLFGTAIIDRLSGRAVIPFQATVKATLARNVASRSGRTDYVRVKLEASGQEMLAHPLFGRSGMLRTLADADGLVMVPAASEGLSAGETIEVVLWS